MQPGTGRTGTGHFLLSPWAAPRGHVRVGPAGVSVCQVVTRSRFYRAVLHGTDVRTRERVKYVTLGG